MRGGCLLMMGIFGSGAVGSYMPFNSSGFNLLLDEASQNLASLSPKVLPSFDFSPFDVLGNRSANGNYHTGDVTLRYRGLGESDWTTVDSSVARNSVKPLPISDDEFASSDISPTLNASLPFGITKSWSFVGDDAILSVTLSNTADEAIEIGSFGFPIEFNSIFTGRTAEETRDKCSLIDPNIGMDGGYVRVTPLTGTGPALVITPVGRTPFEAWRFLHEDESTSLAYQSQTFEGYYSWEVFSKAYTENEWEGVDPWNPGTSAILATGQNLTLGLRLSIAPDIQSIEDTVKNTNTPLAVGLPGYIVPRDVDASLQVYSNSSVVSISTTPTDAFMVTNTSSNAFNLVSSNSTWGRVRLTVNYADNRTQTVHYYIPQSAPDALSKLGNFFTTSAYFNESQDPFARSPSVITYDRDAGSQVTQEPRAWIAGLSDEAGAGSWLAACAKLAAQPNIAEIAKMEDFVQQTLWGTIQTSDFHVRKSVFFYEPDAVNYTYSSNIDWSNWWSWNKAEAYNTGRTYDYVHVAAAYWSLYRVASGYPNTVRGNATWYINQAYQTVNYCLSNGTDGQPNTDYTDVGLMGETVFGELLTDLKRENMSQEASQVEFLMKARAELWDAEEVPFGSEMAWDSTGQEGVYYWTNYFNFTETALKAVNSILGYTPLISHWAYNGNSRRYWDNIYGGKLQRIERQVHHYGSALNSLPILAYYMQNPTNNIDLLRLGYAGNTAPLSNIDLDGFASASFHSWPDTLRWDAYSGDYGPGFLGMVLGSACFIVQDQEAPYDVQSFGGNLRNTTDDEWYVDVKDAVRRKLYLGMFGVKMEINAGIVESVSLRANVVTLVLSPALEGISGVPPAESAILWVEKMSLTAEVEPEIVGNDLEMMKGGWQVDLRNGTVSISIKMG